MGSTPTGRTKKKVDIMKTESIKEHSEKCDSELFRVVSYNKEDDFEFFVQCDKCKKLISKIEKKV